MVIAKEDIDTPIAKMEMNNWKDDSDDEEEVEDEEASIKEFMSNEIRKMLQNGQLRDKRGKLTAQALNELNDKSNRSLRYVQLTPEFIATIGTLEDNGKFYIGQGDELMDISKCQKWMNEVVDELLKIDTEESVSLVEVKF
jgi:hypothetical protein